MQNGKWKQEVRDIPGSTAVYLGCCHDLLCSLLMGSMSQLVNRNVWAWITTELMPFLLSTGWSVGSGWTLNDENKECDPIFYVNIFIIPKFCATFPLTSCEYDRTFSMLRQVHVYHGTAKTEFFGTDVYTMLHIYHYKGHCSSICIRNPSKMKLPNFFLSHIVSYFSKFIVNTKIPSVSLDSVSVCVYGCMCVCVHAHVHVCVHVNFVILGDVLHEWNDVILEGYEPSPTIRI